MLGARPRLVLWDTEKTRRYCGGCAGRPLTDAERAVRELALHARFFAARRSTARVRTEIAGHPDDERADGEHGTGSMGQSCN